MNPNRDTSLILIADDNPVNLELLSDTLGVEGYDIAVASDGEMAIERVRLEPPDLILLDAMMPGVDGFEACKRLKNDPATSDIPVIFMTALTDVSHKLRGLRLGAVDYLVKPFEQEEVVLRVKNHLALRSATRSLAEKNAALERQMEERAAAEAARAALTSELERRTEELRGAKEHLERELAERKDSEAARAAMAEQIIALQAKQLHELSTPIIPITDWLVVMPLIGVMDDARAAQALETALRGASERRAEIVIIDITGVPTIDAAVASALLRAARALRLIGARTVLTGIRPEVARTLANINMDPSGIVTRGTLQGGIAHAMSARHASSAPSASSSLSLSRRIAG
jgi:DNA-binding response OmpR family regulator/anti-anti-sigma regulatory factor